MQAHAITMTTPMHDELEHCPRCGLPFDTRREAVVICPDCLLEGSTQCCNQSGSGALCNECERVQGVIQIGLVRDIPSAHLA